MLEEVGVEYEKELVDIRDPNAIRDKDFSEASPMGKVPALADGDVKIAESAAICLYLADRYASGHLAPAVDAADRGKFLYWMFFAPSVMEAAMAEKCGGWEPNRGQHGWGDFDAMIDVLERGLDEKLWLLGEQFSAADVMVGSTAAFMQMFGALPDSLVLQSYVQRCLDRPAYQRAMANEG